jgi:dimethylamine monooxygenase subunit A
MQPGLFRLGTDFGNGTADQALFPRDANEPRYLAEKARVLSQSPDRDDMALAGSADEQAIEAARAWFEGALRAEGHERAALAAHGELGRELMEDFAVLRLDPHAGDRAIWVHACFPSGWRPEHVLGQSFAGIHQRVPAFDAVARRAASLVEAMVERGPYLRFVWTISADDELDHHPSEGRRSAWGDDTTRAYLRVERQVMVPLPAVGASVFLIRTYLYGFDELADDQRRTLAEALRQMPPEIARYKGLTAALPRALALLG